MTNLQLKTPTSKSALTSSNAAVFSSCCDFRDMTRNLDQDDQFLMNTIVTLHVGKD